MCAAWQKSCEEAEALYNETLSRVLGLYDQLTTVDSVSEEGGVPSDRSDPYRILPISAAGLSINQEFPQMPRQAGLYRHTKRKGLHILYNAAASRPVSRSEIKEKVLPGGTLHGAFPYGPLWFTKTSL